MSCSLATLDGIDDATELEEKQITYIEHLAIDMEDDNAVNEEWNIVLRQSDILIKVIGPEKDSRRKRPRMQIDLTSRSCDLNLVTSYKYADCFAFALCLILIASLIIYCFLE